MTDINRNFYDNSPLSTIVGKKEIEQRITNLLEINSSEIPFNRKYGLANLLNFEICPGSMDDTQLLDRVTDIVEYAIPGLVPDPSTSSITPDPDHNTVTIALGYIYKGNTGVWTHTFKGTL